jgi:hypothetical protein
MICNAPNAKAMGRYRRMFHERTGYIFNMMAATPLSHEELFTRAKHNYGYTIKQITKSLFYLLDTEAIAKCAYCYRYTINWQKRQYPICPECEINIQSQVSS